MKSWEDNWEVLSIFYEYPPEIRKIIYTTNMIEGLKRQFRQITKSKPSFTNDDSLRKPAVCVSHFVSRSFLGGVLVKVPLPIVSPAGQRFRALVRQAFRFQHDGIRSRPNGLGRYQRVIHSRKTFPQNVR